MSDPSVLTLQARDSTVTPPSMALAPAGPGAAPARWCHDPVQRCSTVSDTTPPVSPRCQPRFGKQTIDSKTRFNLIPHHHHRLPITADSSSPRADPVYVIVYTEN